MAFACVENGWRRNLDKPACQNTPKTRREGVSLRKPLVKSSPSHRRSVIFKMAGKFLIRIFRKNVEFPTVWMIHLLYSMLLRIPKIWDLFAIVSRVFKSVKFRLETYCQVAITSTELFLLLTFSGSSCSDAEIFWTQNRKFGTWYTKLASC